MLYYGTIYCDTKEKLDEVMTPLRAAGFDVAYQTPTGGMLVKEDTNEPSDQES